MNNSELNSKKHLVLGEKYYDLLDAAIKKLGLVPLYVPDNPDVDYRLSGHADLSVFYSGGENIFLAPYLQNSDFSRKLIDSGLEVRFCDIKQAEKYPFDAQMNACLCGNALLYSENVTCNDIIKYLTNSREIDLLNCRQGYLNCSVCVVDDNSIITADRGVYAVCKEAGIDVLLISPGFVELTGFDYGFIGGASFKIEDKVLAFTGSLEAHPDCEAILEFIKSKDVEPVFLTDLPIFDIGGAIII